MASTNVTSSKVCSKCGVEKPIDLFPLRSAGSSTVRSHCKACFAVKQKVLRVNNADKYKEVEAVRRSCRKAYFTELYAQQRVNRRLKAKQLYTPRPEPTSCKVYFLTCEVTGELFASKRSYTRFSPLGAKLFNAERARLNDRDSFVSETIICKYCSVSFDTEHGSKNRTYCSTACSKASARSKQKHVKNYKRRAKVYGCAFEPVNVFAVFNRDKWTCQLCGIKTPKSLRGTLLDNAPELDHIIPLSRKGGHTYSNVQCACRKCNISKGNKVIGQLLITC